MELLEYAFVCPNCNKEYYTYIERSYYQKLLEQNIDKNIIFEKFPDSYKGLFTIGYCNKCLTKEFNIRYKNYTAEYNTSNIIYDEIYDLYNE